VEDVRIEELMAVLTEESVGARMPLYVHKTVEASPSPSIKPGRTAMRPFETRKRPTYPAGEAPVPTRPVETAAEAVDIASVYQPPLAGHRYLPFAMGRRTEPDESSSRSFHAISDILRLSKTRCTRWRWPTIAPIVGNEFPHSGQGAGPYCQRQSPIPSSPRYLFRGDETGELPALGSIDLAEESVALVPVLSPRPNLDERPSIARVDVGERRLYLLPLMRAVRKRPDLRETDR